MRVSSNLYDMKVGKCSSAINRYGNEEIYQLNPGQSVIGVRPDIKPTCYRRTPVSMSSPAGTITPLGESLASSFCGSLTPIAISPSGEGGFETGFMSSRGPAVIQDHIRSRPPQIQPACLPLSCLASAQSEPARSPSSCMIDSGLSTALTAALTIQQTALF